MSVGENPIAQQALAGQFWLWPTVKVDLQRSSFAAAEWSVTIQALQCLQKLRANLYSVLCCVWINIKAV
jgi:hypothetical protein